jgi:phosphatidylglycerol:prolipoprotein diacylglycerol transferase
VRSPDAHLRVLGAVLIFLWLWREATKSANGERPAGWILGEYFILTGAARFLVEFIRINPRVWLGLTNAQIASAGSGIAGIVLLLVLSGMKKRRPAASG